ncbi:protein S40-4-like [Rosa rugosa]|uniref:protein S40-4-like n=1 Tax=Rosa rugosa TaxID=74645 RepID=UPI002B40577B|nr:protein S40-4-like [Rosa rugosa]
MATSKTYYARPNYRYLPTDHHHQTLGADSAFELDESDIYNFARSSSPEYRKPAMSSRVVSSAASKKSASSKRSDAGDRNGGTAASLPVGIPDWSKILRDEYRENRRSGDDDDDLDDGSVRVPPHEFLARQMARTRIASFSVHEGVGRTLKGRDLSRVRNAIWEKTGFED